MDVYVFASGGLVDEVLVTDGALAVRRTGTARYVAQFDEAHAAVELELWTSKKGRVRVDAWPDCPSWVHVRMGADATLDAIDATGAEAIRQWGRSMGLLPRGRGGATWLASIGNYAEMSRRPAAMQHNLLTTRMM